MRREGFLALRRIYILLLLSVAGQLWSTANGAALAGQTPLQPSTATQRASTSQQQGLLHSRLLSITTPPLPSLDADPFLPAPDPYADIYLVIKLADRRVYVYDEDQLKMSFPVAIGRSGWETPTGQFKVLQMQRHPTWQNPFTGELIPAGADNPLGSRWIGFWTDGSNFIGFHGTPNEDSVGTAASHGCIRMYDRDVVKLYEMVTLGTPVIVTH